MVNPSGQEPISPYGMAIGGAVLSAIFSYATYSSVHKQAFLIAAVAGSIFCLLLRLLVERVEDSDEMQKVWIGLPGALFGYVTPIMGGGYLLALSILSSSAPPFASPFYNSRYFLEKSECIGWRKFRLYSHECCL